MKTIGAIVTLRDMTGENRSKEDLGKTLQDLRQVQGEVKRQNRELTYLANHDSVTGCLNRRAFFGRFQTEMEEAPDLGTPINVMMIGFDQYRYISGKYGPVTGDALIIAVANIIKAECGSLINIARHSGEIFTLALMGIDETESSELANKIREEISISSRELLPAGQQATVSIGLTQRTSGACTVHSLINQAEQALKSAMANGADQIVIWDNNTNSGSRNKTTEPGATEITQAHPLGQNSTSLPGELATSAPFDAKTLFYNQADKSIALAQQNNVPLAILHLSLTTWEYLDEALDDELKPKIMQRIEEKISASLREQDAVLRLGDTGEWIIKLTGLENPDDAKWIIRRLLETLRAPFQANDKSIYVSCKIGVSMFPENGRDVSTLARQAKFAMRRAWEDHLLDGYKFYETGMTDNSRERLNIETGIRQALQNKEFELFFQPIVDAKSGALSSVEALLRCDNDKLRGIPMDKVIHVAEKSSLIAEIDMWVLRQALKQMQDWIKAGIKLPKISINLSAKQFNNIEFMDHVFESIQSAPFPPSRVQIEVTETANIGDVEIAGPQIKRLQQLGVQIALDDFGTGQASLTYLQRLHPDVIKIDRSFTHGVNTNHANATLVSAMVVMAHCLGLKVVIEGVEDEEQFNFLQSTQCDEIQGYFISKPMPARAMGDWMKLFVSNNGAAGFVVAGKAKGEPITSLTSNSKAA